MLVAECSLPSPCSKVLADADCVVSSPGAVRAEIGWTQIAVTRSQPIEKEMLGHAHFKAFAHVDRGAPGMFHANGIKRPCVERVWNVLSEEEARLSKQHEPAQRAPAKRTRLQQTREHVTGKSCAGSVHASEGAGVGAANVGINFVVWRRDIKLGIPPKSIGRQEHSFSAALVGLLGLGTKARQRY